MDAGSFYCGPQGASSHVQHVTTPRETLLPSIQAKAIPLIGSALFPGHYAVTCSWL
jgi:hypothetical protein